MFDWKFYEDTELLLTEKVKWFLSNHRRAKDLASRIEKGTSTRIMDWIDHMVISSEDLDMDELEERGIKRISTADVDGATVHRNIGSTLFPILIVDVGPTELALKPENLDTFRLVNSIGSRIQGKKFSRYRKLVIDRDDDFILTAVERRGYAGFKIKGSDDIMHYRKALKDLGARKRNFSTSGEGFAFLDNILRRYAKKLSFSRFADAFYRSERSFWQRKNRAGRIQFKRQDRFGLGWGNHDHMAFRSSRKNYLPLIQFLESIGMASRERFYAGAEAGWGAQVLEDKDCSTVVFADVDLSARETSKDFAHKGLAPKNSLGTIGMWTALHGESILRSGLHHLAARFRFHDIIVALRKEGESMMHPFSSFTYLKQAFTVGESWNVRPALANALVKHGIIDKDLRKRFVEMGVVGSHLENIQRTQGFKGFNQMAVSKIIEATDPRRS